MTLKRFYQTFFGSAGMSTEGLTDNDIKYLFYSNTDRSVAAKEWKNYHPIVCIFLGRFIDYSFIQPIPCSTEFSFHDPLLRVLFYENGEFDEEAYEYFLSSVEPHIFFGKDDGNLNMLCGIRQQLQMIYSTNPLLFASTLKGMPIIDFEPKNAIPESSND